MYLEVSPAAGRRFFSRGLDGPVTMLNLLRFREHADYSTAPDLAPPVPVSGAEAYETYERHTKPFLEAAGGRVVFRGVGGPLLIGPEHARWDLVLLVEHASVEAFLSFATDEAYLAGLGHRTAALADSRLLPIEVGKTAGS